MTTLDLSPYVASGFPLDYDEGIPKVGVAGIDKQQAVEMVRLCPETEAILYGPSWSPQALRYEPGSRPQLEAIAATWRDLDPVTRIHAASKWVHDHVEHPHLCGPTAPDRGMTEEELIDSGRGWCNEQHRVFVALLQTLEIPGRLVFLFHDPIRCGHTTCEVLLDGRWVFVDVTFGVTVPLADGRMAEVREICGSKRRLADAAYEPALRDYYANAMPYVEELPAWGPTTRPLVDRGGDLLAAIGITNYVIDGCSPA